MRQFAQLYSLHVDLGSTSHLNYEYPVVFANLPDKKEKHNSAEELVFFLVIKN